MSEQGFIVATSDVRALLEQHRLAAGAEPDAMLTVPYAVLDTFLASVEQAEAAIERVRVWKDGAWLTMSDAAAVIESLGDGDSRMLARRIRVARETVL